MYGRRWLLLWNLAGALWLISKWWVRMSIFILRPTYLVIPLTRRSLTHFALWISATMWVIRHMVLVKVKMTANFLVIVRRLMLLCRGPLSTRKSLFTLMITTCLRNVAFLIRVRQPFKTIIIIGCSCLLVELLFNKRSTFLINFAFLFLSFLSECVLWLKARIVRLESELMGIADWKWILLFESTKRWIWWWLLERIARQMCLERLVATEAIERLLHVWLLTSCITALIARRVEVIIVAKSILSLRLHSIWRSLWFL